MKVFHKSTDERVTNEVNRVYKVGYYILTFGIFIDLCLRAVALRQEIRGAGLSFWLEFGVLVGAQLVCVVMMAHRGLMDDNGYAEADVFPLGHYCLLGAGAGAVTAALLSIYNYCVSPAWAAFEDGLLLQAVAVQFLFIVPITAVLIVLLYYAAYRTAKKRRGKQLEEDE